MIIQCEQCQTKFKLDDSRVADKAIKVRCARCKHVFSVAGLKDVAGEPAAAEQNAQVFQVEDELETPATGEEESTLAFEPEVTPEEDSSDRSDLLDSFSFETDDDQGVVDTPAPAGDDSGFSFPSVESTAAHDQTEIQNDSDAMDFGAFDFGDDSGDAAEPAAPDAQQWKAAAPQKEEFGGLDFSGDDMFGDVVSTTSEEETSESISFDMGMDGFADSMGVESGPAGQSSTLAAQEQAAESPFSLDDIDFGDELTAVAVQQVSTEELKPSQDGLFAPLAAAQTKTELDSGFDVFDKPAAAPAQEELPPLSISSRRKETPRVSGMLLFMGVIIAGLIVFYSYWGYKMLTEDKGTIAQETGRITVRSVEASFIKNKKTGDLLVISGEAVNEYNKPRAAIEIKGIVFGADGEEVSSKTAFCGNVLSNEQLTSMTMEKIEAAMANQFGDSLANMEVPPGEAIPFMIVIPKPPKGATDYGVETVGSTVAAGDKEK
ncbi:MAG: zinc-ribbon domain-containing protein [Geobacteraceae bacterium]|nr:zinc-ribbon domain-containing protein [Geobacteraceae bacterium]